MNIETITLAMREAMAAVEAGNRNGEAMVIAAIRMIDGVGEVHAEAATMGSHYYEVVPANGSDSFTVRCSNHARKSRHNSYHSTPIADFVDDKNDAAFRFNIMSIASECGIDQPELNELRNFMQSL